MNVSRWIVVVLICASCASSHAADDFAKPHVADPTETHKARFERYLAVRINELTRVCDLTDKQIKKLEVAKKGAVEEALQKLPKPGQAGQPDLHVGAFPAPVRLELAIAPEPELIQNPAVDPPGDDAEPEPPQATAEAAPLALPAAPVAAAPALQVVNVLQHGFVGDSTVADTQIWRNTVRRVLTPPQTNAYHQAQEKRAQYKRQVIVNRGLAAIDAQLFLTETQRTKLAEHLLKHADRTIDRIFPANAALADAQIAAQLARLVPKSTLTGLLDPAQIDRWDDMQQQQQGNFVFFGGFNR